MKKIKRISLLISIILIFTFIFSFAASAHDDIKEIADNDKIYANVPWEYELMVLSNTLSYSDEDGDTITYCVGENKFAPDGITELAAEKVQVVFEHYYLYEGDIERIDECFVKYTETKKEKVNGYSCYYVTGNYAYTEDELNSDFAYYFNAFVFATKEDVFVVCYEGMEETELLESSLPTAVYGIVFNGTPLNGDKPEHNADHNFSDSPTFEEAVQTAQQETISSVMEEENIIEIIAGVMSLIFIAPTVALIIVAIVLITKYSKNKNILKRYEMTYGSISAYNTYQQNYGGYGYNQPFNQPFQPPVNPVYQNNPQAPSYVTDAINNLEAQQPIQITEDKETENNDCEGE